MGRKPLPSHLKVLRGTDQPSRMNPCEPKPASGIPCCPAHLGAEARREGKRASKLLDEIGVLTVVDRAALAAYCQAWAIWVEASEKLSQTGLLTMTSNGNLIQSPLLGIANTAQREMRAWMTECGMTPSSRTRIAADPEPKEDEFDKFLNRGRNPVG